jgi:16S rRNA (uracil1498-N3)-methyltransferase
MTRRRFYATPDSFSADKTSATLNADETRHLRDVLRLTTGDEVCVFNGEGREFRCAIVEIKRTSVCLKIAQEVAPARPESPLDFALAVALLKGEKFDLVVQKATELGVTSLVPIVTSRADVKIRSDDDSGRKVSRWQRIALEATKQCGRARLMKIEAPTRFSDLIDQPANSGEGRFMFAEREGVSFQTALQTLPNRPDKVTALIGSEGGFSDEEIAKTRDSDWKIVTLGGRVMRAETAAIAIAALLQHRFGDLT